MKPPKKIMIFGRPGSGKKEKIMLYKSLWHITLLFQFLLLLYHQITTNLSMFPFNDLEKLPLKHRFFESISNGILMILPPLGLVFEIEHLTRFSLYFYPLLLVGEFFSWWKHYLFGPSDWFLNTSARFFSRTITILPLIKNHPRLPDLQHCILHGLTLVTAFLTLLLHSG